MKLVKDFINDQTVYYWVESAETLDAISPNFRSFVQAEEWWKEFMFSQFRGEEKRHSHHDRRQDHDTRQKIGTTQKEKDSSATVRRVTDLSIKVEVDLHQEKT